MRRKSNGFVLLETLLAIVILSGALVCVLDGVRSGLHVQKAAHDQYRAMLLLEAMMALAQQSHHLADLPTEDEELGTLRWTTGTRWRLTWGNESNEQNEELSAVSCE